MTTTGGEAGDSAEQTALAEVRLRISPVASEDVERLGHMFTRLPAVAGVRTLQVEGTTATYAVQTPSKARLLAELGQVATMIGAAVTRSIRGEVVFALPANTAPDLPANAITPPEATSPIPEQSTTPTGGHNPSRSHRVDPVSSGTARQRHARRARLRALPRADEPRPSPHARLRNGLAAWHQRQARARARRGRSWSAFLGVIALAAIMTIGLTASQQCGDERGALSAPSNRGAVGRGRVFPTP